MSVDSRAVVSDLDSCDRQIIALLQEDGRRSNASIARLVGVSESTVKSRISRLIATGVIHILAAVDPSAVGHGQHALVGINVKPGTIFEVGDFLCQMNEVVFLGYVTGRYDLMIELLVTDSDDLLHFLAKRVAGIEGIVSLETFFIMRNQKVNYYNWAVPDELPQTRSLARGNWHWSPE